ncbi:MAG: DoxX family protein [Acidobacteriota bacterium]
MTQTLNRLQAMVAAAGDRLQSPFLLLIRLYWGWQLVQTGWGKLHTLDKVTEFFSSLGLPAPGPTAALVGTLEFAGGILLILGLASRLISIPLTISMFTAYVTADKEALFSFFSEPDKFYAAAPFTFLFAVLIVLIFGPGKFSVDELFHWNTEPAREERHAPIGRMAL